MREKKTLGFTLIELLVVISIIGILSSLGMVSLNNARVKARDALRKADMTQLRTAIMLYYDENNKYPACGVWDESREDFGAAPDQTYADCYKNSLTSAIAAGSRPYLSPMPKDPLNPQNNPGDNDTYFYRYVGKTDGTQYALVYRIESNDGLQVIRGW